MNIAKRKLVGRPFQGQLANGKTVVSGSDKLYMAAAPWCEGALPVSMSVIYAIDMATTVNRIISDTILFIVKYLS
jgi:hypothetical protein